VTALHALAASGLDLHHINVGAVVGIAFLVLIFRAWLGK
jgi:hypothetical protein